MLLFLRIDFVGRQAANTYEQVALLPLGYSAIAERMNSNRERSADRMWIADTFAGCRSAVRHPGSRSARHIDLDVQQL